VSDQTRSVKRSVPKASNGTAPARGRLSEQDLIPDQALRPDDQDAFNHEAIAVALADLVVTADAPLNVALFGRWGSGKSSLYELLRREVKKNDPKEKVALVRYDAWKYGGESLQRNFISFAATALGFDDADKDREFHRGLYEKRRGAELKFASVDGHTRRQRLRQQTAPLCIFAWVFSALVIIFSVLVGLASLATDENFLGEIARTLPGFLVSTGGVAVLVAGAKVVMDGVTTDVEQSQPSAEEQFSKTFDKLVTRAKNQKNKKTRLVFFIDELDRCSPDDVVATLTGIKTFLGHNDCVFIVAADREVLECGLKQLPQSTPYDEENPYYSSASSFFDKVFQHQMPLPPLRGQRLTKFARDIVLERGGLWKELRDAEPNNRLLYRVVYVLVPSHVRSPRRVKVLLNSFATNVRIAEGRNIDWRARATELAKLTAIQTEFPRLAADLHQEPRLLEYLIKAPPNPSHRVAALLKKHGMGHASSDFVGGAATNETKGDEDEETEETHVTQGELDAAQPTDLPLESTSPSQTRSALVGMQHALLRRYLERTAGVGALGRQLLFLEAAGAAVGLEDGALGELIETYAPESPARVVRAMEARTTNEQLQVVGVLAAMSEDEFGEERRNVMTALLGVTRLVKEPLGVTGHTAVAAVNSFETEQLLDEDRLLDALKLALSVDDADADSLAVRIGRRPELLTSTTRVKQAAGLLDRLPGDIAGQVYKRVAEEMADDPDVLLEPLGSLPPDAAKALYRAAPVEKAVSRAILSEEDQGAFVEQLVAVASHYEDLAKDVQEQLLHRSHRYDTAWMNASTVRESLTREEANDHALLALDHAPPEHWPEWVTYLDPEAESTAGWASWPAARLVGESAVDVDADVVIATLKRIVPFLRGTSLEDRRRITEALGENLDTATWWESTEQSAVQLVKHRIARVLLEADDSILVDAVARVLVDDIERPRLVAEEVGTAITGEATFSGLRQMGAQLPAENVAELYEAWSQAAVDPSDWVQQRLTVALLRLAAVANRAGFELDTSELTVDRLIAMPDLLVRHRQLTPVEDWLSLTPTTEDVVRLLKSKGPASCRSAVHQYCNGLTVAERTRLADLVFVNRVRADWLETVGEKDVDDDALVKTFTLAIAEGATDQARNEAAQYIVALKPTTGGAQKLLAELIVNLVDSGKKGQFETAQRLLCVLKPNHRSGKSLKEAFVRAADESDLKLPLKRVKELEHANVALPKKAQKAQKTLMTKALEQAKKAVKGN
jgi:hypothetical protein